MTLVKYYYYPEEKKKLQIPHFIKHSLSILMIKKKNEIVGSSFLVWDFARLYSMLTVSISFVN